MTNEDCCLDPSLAHKLSKLDNGLGIYLALTGTPLFGANIWHAGLATIYMPNDSLPNLEEAIRSMDKFTFTDIWNTLLYVMEDPGIENISENQLNYIKE